MSAAATTSRTAESLMRGVPGRLALVDQVLEDRADDCLSPRIVGAGLRGEIDALEHELPEREHRLADLRALLNVAGVRRRHDDVVDEPIDPAGPRRAEDLDLLARQLVRREHAGPDGVVDVVVDVRDPVDELDDPSLERERVGRPGVVENAVAHLLGEVQSSPLPFQHVYDAKRMLVVEEAKPEPFLQCGVEGLLARVAERWVPEVVAEPDRLDEILVEPKRAGDAPRDPRRLERVREPGSVVVALRRDEDLGLVHQPAEGLRMDDAVAVALERSPDAAR